MAGSALGGGLRYMFSLWLRAAAGTFPFATFAVNVVGCFVIGLVSGLPAGAGLNPASRLLLTTGLCGGFTTFSTFSNESLQLLRDGHTALAAAYIGLSLTLGLLAAWGGHAIAE